MVECYSSLGLQISYGVFSETPSGLSWNCAWELTSLTLIVFEHCISRSLYFYFLATVTLTGTTLSWSFDILSCSNISCLGVIDHWRLVLPNLSDLFLKILYSFSSVICDEMNFYFSHVLMFWYLLHFLVLCSIFLHFPFWDTTLKICVICKNKKIK